jgi:hypothetical protein
MRMETITLEELCEAWRDAHRGQTSGHVPTSTLFDLLQSSLRGPEHREAVQHLAECPDCLQDLKELVRIKAQLLLVEKPPVPAVEAVSATPLGQLAHPADRPSPGQEHVSAPSVIGSSLKS